VETILSAVERFHGIEDGAEITLEAHPSTVDRDKLAAFLAAGVSRVSFGGESLQSGELGMLGRTHGSERVLEAVSEARNAGFRSVNVDLMYGLPGQTLHAWQQTLTRLLDLRPQHVSLYPLQIEPGTLFGRRHREGRLRSADDAVVADMYLAACEHMRRAGYDHYEIANWALPGHRSRHNLAYWLDHEYLAAGVGAHAYVHPFRTANIRRVSRYIDRILAGDSVIDEREYIDVDTRLSERVVLGLRLLSDGLDLESLQADFGPEARALVQRLAAHSVADGHLRVQGARLLLREESAPVANEIFDAFVSLKLDSAALA
jgi:oxygen-independent coproporphyrinogen-3 oxidase